MRSRWRRVAAWALALVLLAGAALGIVNLMQRQLMYFPDTTPAGSVSSVPGARDVSVTTDDGLTLDAWLLAPDSGTDRQTAVLYLPGNGGNRSGRLDAGMAIAERGFTVLLLDYRGYGGNSGAPTEVGLAADARAATAFLRAEGFEPSRTLYLGESLGTGVAARLLTTDPPAGAVLRSPFPSFVQVAEVHYPLLPVGRWLKDRYESADRLSASEVPVLVLHGDADTVVPSELSADVAARAGNLLDEVVLPGVGHNDEVWFGPYLADQVVRLADATVPAPRPGAQEAQ